MKGSMCVARALCLLLLAGSPVRAFRGAGFGGGMHFGGGRFGTASGFHGGFGPTFHGSGVASIPGFDFRFHQVFPHRSVFFFGFRHPFFFPSSRVVIVNQPFFFPRFGFSVNAPFFCFPCGISFATEAIFFDHIQRFHHFHGVPPHLHVATGSHAVFVGA
jgi:hypothetical protein